MNRVEINNGIVDSYWIKKYDSGIIQLLINTTDKWVNYHRMSNTHYCIGEYDEQEFTWKSHLEIPELVIPENHLCTEHQEKDQISFYWIPREMVSSGKMRNHIISKRNKNSDHV